VSAKACKSRPATRSHSKKGSRPLSLNRSAELSPSRCPHTAASFEIAGKDADALGKTPAEAGGATASGGDLEAMVWDQLKTCYDPEIPVNIVDLGLVYGMEVKDADDGTKKVEIKMTLTAQGCGMGASIAMDARHKIMGLPGVSEADVDLVWDPPWTPQMISPEGRERLGID
jgi:probable FeS assembly SUF system protein SufT